MFRFSYVPTVILINANPVIIDGCDLVWITYSLWKESFSVGPWSQKNGKEAFEASIETKKKEVQQKCRLWNGSAVQEENLCECVTSSVPRGSGIYHPSFSQWAQMVWYASPLRIDMRTVAGRYDGGIMVGLSYRKERQI
ncbi:hypothetical protein RHSIM_Rhsim05G0111700 [Rhododendron simsii]|uniref:Uncharacterized protein n=1 Tax=Rhododendron simsii TaxID=118357 RepID=A0A834GU87_RHOSS|nr:hypothetical protein RHSIM_Rhsim05G0111700 [Rhododendron simsii]